MATEPVKPQQGIQSIEVGARLLRALAANGRSMMLRDLAKSAAMPAASCLSISKRFSSIAHLSAIFLHPHDTTLFSEINGFPKKYFRNPDFLFDICVLCDMIGA